MNDRLHAGMREASRLTRASRLIDATALLQRMLQSGRGPDPDASNAGVPTTIDLVPEAVEVTGAAYGRPERTGRAQLPDVLHRFLDRGTRSGFALGRAGWRNRLRQMFQSRRAVNSARNPSATKPEAEPTSSMCRANIAASRCR